MDLHKAAVKSDFVTYVDSKKTQPSQNPLSYTPSFNNYQNCFLNGKKDVSKTKGLKCTCRCTCSMKSSQFSISKSKSKVNLEPLLNSDISRESHFEKSFISGPSNSSVITNFVKNVSTQNSPNHQLNINKDHEQERNYLAMKNKLLTDEESEYKNNSEKYQNYSPNSISEGLITNVRSSRFDSFDSPEMIEILRKLEIKSEKLKCKMDTLDEIRDGILKQLENALVTEQTNISLSSSDRTDSKDSGMASISNDQSKSSQLNNKLPVKSILKKPLKSGLESIKYSDYSLSNKEDPQKTLTEISNLQSDKWPLERQFQYQSLYTDKVDEITCRRRSFDMKSPCFTNVPHNSYSHSDLTTNHIEKESLNNEKSPKKTAHQYGESIIFTNSNALDIICFLEDQLSDPPSPAPQLLDDVYFQ